MTLPAGRLSPRNQPFGDVKDGEELLAPVNEGALKGFNSDALTAPLHKASLTLPGGTQLASSAAYTGMATQRVFDAPHKTSSPQSAAEKAEAEKKLQESRDALDRILDEFEKSDPKSEAANYEKFSDSFIEMVGKLQNQPNVTSEDKVRLAKACRYCSESFVLKIMNLKSNPDNQNQPDYLTNLDLWTKKATQWFKKARDYAASDREDREQLACDILELSLFVVGRVQYRTVYWQINERINEKLDQLIKRHLNNPEWRAWLIHQILVRNYFCKCYSPERFSNRSAMQLLPLLLEEKEPHLRFPEAFHLVIYSWFNFNSVDFEDKDCLKSLFLLATNTLKANDEIFLNISFRYAKALGRSLSEATSQGEAAIYSIMQEITECHTKWEREKRKT